MNQLRYFLALISLSYTLALTPSLYGAEIPVTFYWQAAYLQESEARFMEISDAPIFGVLLTSERLKEPQSFSWLAPSQGAYHFRIKNRIGKILVRGSFVVIAPQPAAGGLLNWDPPQGFGDFVLKVYTPDQAMELHRNPQMPYQVTPRDVAQLIQIESLNIRHNQINFKTFNYGLIMDENTAPATEEVSLPETQEPLHETEASVAQETDTDDGVIAEPIRALDWRLQLAVQPSSINIERTQAPDVYTGQDLEVGVSMSFDSYFWADRLYLGLGAGYSQAELDLDSVVTVGEPSEAKLRYSFFESTAKLGLNILALLDMRQQALNLAYIYQARAYDQVPELVLRGQAQGVFTNKSLAGHGFGLSYVYQGAIWSLLSEGQVMTTQLADYNVEVSGLKLVSDWRLGQQWTLGLHFGVSQEVYEQSCQAQLSCDDQLRLVRWSLGAGPGWVW